MIEPGPKGGDNLSLKESFNFFIADTLTLIILIILAGGVIPSVLQPSILNQEMQGMPWFWDGVIFASTELHKHSGWALTIYLTAMLSLYAISAGEQLYGAQGSGKLRHHLSYIGRMLAAATMILVISEVIYCSFVATWTWSIFFVLGPIAMTIIFLALQLSGFVIIPWADRINRLKLSKDRVSMKIDSISKFQVNVNSFSIIASPFLIAIPAIVVSLMVENNFHWVPLFFIFLLLSILTLFLAGYAVYQSMRFDTSSGLAFWFMFCMLQAIILISSLVLIVEPERKYYSTALGLIVVAALSSCLSLWRHGHKMSCVNKFLIRNFASKLALDSLKYELNKIDKEINRIQKELTRRNHASRVHRTNFPSLIRPYTRVVRTRSSESR